MTARPGTIEITAKGEQALRNLAGDIGKAPIAAYFWIRTALFKWAIDHRSFFLKHTSARLRSKGTANNPDPIVPYRVDSGAPDKFERGLQWEITPKETRRPDASPEVVRSLRLEIASASTILEALEEGLEEFPKEKRLLAIPLRLPGAKGRSRLSPRNFRKFHPTEKIIARKVNGVVVLYQRKRRRKAPRTRVKLDKKGNPRKRQPMVWADTLIPRWVLVPRVRIKDRLGFYWAWDARSDVRGKILADVATRLAKDIANGVTT